MKTGVATAIATALLALPFLAAADCDTFKLGKERPEAYTRTHNSTFSVSRGVNCTEDWARGKGEEKRCEWEVPRYTMGLEVHPYLDPIRVDTAQRTRILELVRTAGGPTAQHVTDFNETVVMNYTASTTRLRLRVGQTGHLGFTPIMYCFHGTLSGCGDDALVQDGTAIRACGYAVENQWREPVRYLGEEAFITTASISDKDPQPPYEDIAGNATANQDGKGEDSEDEKNGDSSAMCLGVEFSALMAAAMSFAVLF